MMQHYSSKETLRFVGALFIMLCFGGVRCSSSPKDVPRNIVLITIDTLRADHLSCYGYERKTSPAIDSIAAEGITFKNVLAASSWTAPSMVSLMTSVYPVNHGVIHGLGYNAEKTPDTQEVFSNELATLAETLSAHGYTTFGVASNLHLSEKFGFARGFDYFICLPFLPAAVVNETIYAWENEIKTSDKFFLWVHYFDPHHPYHAREPWINGYTSRELLEKFDFQEKSWEELCERIPSFETNPDMLGHLIALYDSEINCVDSHAGELIKRFDLDKDTLIIITSDHGEEFLEHGKLGHGSNLYGETVNIPLVMKLPDRCEKKVVTEQVSLVDIMPTILDALGFRVPEQCLGKPLLNKPGPLLRLKEKLTGSDREPYAFTELDTRASMKAILNPPWKYIYDYKSKTEQLYNIASDPLELNNRAAAETIDRDQLQKQLFRWVEQAERYPTGKFTFELTAEQREALEALGYIQ